MLYYSLNIVILILLIGLSIFGNKSPIEWWWKLNALYLLMTLWGTGWSNWDLCTLTWLLCHFKYQVCYELLCTTDTYHSLLIENKHWFCGMKEWDFASFIIIYCWVTDSLKSWVKTINFFFSQFLWVRSLRVA